MTTISILLDFFDQISKVNSAWSVAAFTVTGILLAIRYVAKIGKGKAINVIILVCVSLMFLMGLAPIIASKIIPTPPLADDISYKIITEVRDSSNMMYDLADLKLTNSLNIPARHVDNAWEFKFNNTDLTKDSTITITAQATNKLFGYSTIKITGNLNYTTTIILKKIVVWPPEPRKRTFSLSAGSTSIAQIISKRTGYINIDKTPQYKIAISYDPTNIKYNSVANNYMLDECYPLITINGIICAKVNCCKIEGAGPVTDKSIITSYVNKTISESADKCYRDQINNIIACLH